MRFPRSILAPAVAVALFSGASVFAQEPRLVLKGHDPVAYFTEGKPVKGNPKITYDWDEGRYHFANAKHRAMFSADPERYAPQFAGYCTGSMSRGVRIEGNPEAWVIVDAKLYVFGAPDSATAIQHREHAQRDLNAFRAKAAKAGGNWPAKQ